MKRRKRIMALLAAICLLAAMVPMTGVAAEEVKFKTVRVLCNGQTLNGASITVSAKAKGDTSGDATVLGTSSTGEVTVTADMSEMEGKVIEVTIILPEGYEYTTYSNNVSRNEFEPEHFFKNQEGIWRAVQVKNEEALIVDGDYYEMRVGGRLSINGAFDVNANGNTDMASLYLRTADGTRTRVVCSSYTESNPELYTRESGEPNTLRMAKAGTGTITFYYGEYSVTITLVVKENNYNNPTDNSGQSYDIFRHSILHNGQVLEGAEITIRLGNEDGTDSIVFATSNTGVIEVSRSSAELKNYEWFYIEMKLPEGYQFLTPGNMQNETTIGYEMKTILDQNLFLGDETCEVVNPAVDGSLEVSGTRIEAKMGDVIDISGAFDLNAEDIQLYYTAPDGVRTRVVCDDYSIIQENRVQEDGYKLKVVEYGLTEIIFFYKNAMAKFEIIAPNPDFPSETIEISDNEYIYIYPDGTETRVIFSEDDINYAFLEGNKDYVPTGGRFESRPVMTGEIFNKAKDAIKKNFKTENLRVFEMNLWDALGRAVHQLPGMVKVEMELPEDFKIADERTLLVYRLEDNGNLTKCSTTLTDGWVSFLTNHFSTYILAEVDPKEAEPKENTETTPTNSATPGGTVPGNAAISGNTATSPKTADYTVSVAPWIMIAALAGLVVVNRRKRV